MSKNDQVLLNSTLEAEKLNGYDGIKESEFFEIYVATQILKSKQLTPEQIEGGCTGGSGDGGVDSFYVFVNDELIEEMPEAAFFQNLSAEPTLELALIQSKLETGFKETPTERFRSFSEDLINLEETNSDYDGVYSDHLTTQINLFKDIYIKLAPKHPKLRVNFYYATRATSDDVPKSVRRKSDLCTELVKKEVSGAESTFSFLPASALIKLARKKISKSFTIELKESPIRHDTQNAFIGIVQLSKYAEFLTDETQKIRQNIFESNVRDYQGNVVVNKAIKTTLENGAPQEDFWWMNNGVTIITTNISQNGKQITIEDPQIVNGLQTSREIFSYAQDHPQKIIEDERNVLIRIINPDTEGSRDKIIKFTNSQTKVPEASLRATDKIHRDIEDHLKSLDIYYDRRKNYYINTGKPRNKIISIALLAQGVMSTLLKRPNDARARPSSLLKNDDDYSNIFNDGLSVDMYYRIARSLLDLDARLKLHLLQLTSNQRNDIRFYALMHALGKATGKRGYGMKDICELDDQAVTSSLIDSSIAAVHAIYESLGGNDKVAKGTKLKSVILDDL